MTSNFYLPRKLRSEDHTYTEEELLRESNYIIILSEPGGGKTELLNSLAQKIETPLETATRFTITNPSRKRQPIIIDAFDELSKIETNSSYALHKLLGKAAETEPTRFIISSRSSEWDDSATKSVENFFREPPLVVRLVEFSEPEQKKIFKNHSPDEDFRNFYSEVTRFELQPLLPNPQFLKMLTDAYLESEREFTNKRSIFKLAVERLAKEVNKTTPRTHHALSTSQKIEISSEVFAKLLLAGAEGVSVAEAFEDRVNPALSSLVNSSEPITEILGTRLFKLGNNPNQHHPTHKIVAEYCAADYLVQRISDRAAPLALPTCLSIIAPNSTVRDELRGLLGWMATLGNHDIQKETIELDPFAVLANGDPSQLDPKSKQQLLSALEAIEKEYPYFRRNDLCRRFSVSGFFTTEIIDDVKIHLARKNSGQFRTLLLEMLLESSINHSLKGDLRQILLDTEERKYNRLLANQSLLKTENYDKEYDLRCLISEASETSLRIATNNIISLGIYKFELQLLEHLLRKCSELYPKQSRSIRSNFTNRDFINDLIKELDTCSTEKLLDSLSSSISCSCELDSYHCYCRNGISKIIGLMLDHYFDVAKPQFDPTRVWSWIKNLRFQRDKSSKNSKSVQILREDKGLRQAIFTLIFDKVTDPEQILQIKIYQLGTHNHSGLSLLYEDQEFLINLAFNSDNPALWSSFFAHHKRHHQREIKTQDPLRHCMRVQALEKPEFMREWAKHQKKAQLRLKQEKQDWINPQRRRARRTQKKKQKTCTHNKNYIQNRRQLIESGKDPNVLLFFAELVLREPEHIEQEVGDFQIVRKALTNCLTSIEQEIPTLQELAKLQCASKSMNIEKILYASCIEIMRSEKSLRSVNPSLVAALKTNLNMIYPGVKQSERADLKSEVNHLLFKSKESAERFLRQYLEPQIAQPQCQHPEVDLLTRDDVFKDLRSKLSIEWLEQFDNIAYLALDSLFECAAQHGDRTKLNQIILTRCSKLFLARSAAPTDEDIEQKCKFWFIRAFCFLSLQKAAPFWSCLTSDRNTVLQLYRVVDRLRYEDRSYWPKLSSAKIKTILDNFFDKWPKVPLPHAWGSFSPDKEKAYRFLTELIGAIGNDSPDEALPVLSWLRKDTRFAEKIPEIKSIQAEQIKRKALMEFEPPTPENIVNLLDHDAVVTVEGLRKRILQELTKYQKDIHGGEFNSGSRFYSIDKDGNHTRLNEVKSIEIIAERLSLVLCSQNIIITPEHQTKNQNRVDITAAKIIDGVRHLVVIEGKGQWHKNLYSAASTQLHDRYSIHPDAKFQGIYLVLWFGIDELVAGRKNHDIKSASELKRRIEHHIPREIKGRIDVFVLDVSI
ncbi:NACHT domain-containing protein [Desulfobaculum sp. SPO524]|uniref:NACHT domain-containing protein n=1 Tax=Desulfobaculum sp. SPO524 TaxID=3378071 RepID=UPI0038524C6E